MYLDILTLRTKFPNVFRLVMVAVLFQYIVCIYSFILLISYIYISICIFFKKLKKLTKLFENYCVSYMEETLSTKHKSYKILLNYTLQPKLLFLPV